MRYKRKLQGIRVANADEAQGGLTALKYNLSGK